MKGQKGQGVLEFGLGLFLVAFVVLAVYALLQSMPKPDFQAAGQALEAVAMPQVKIPQWVDHQTDRHADVISASVMCFSGYGTMHPTSMFRQSDKHSAWMCQMDGGMYVWIVDEFGRTVTQFKNKAKTFEDAMKYLLKQGYVIPE